MLKSVWGSKAAINSAKHGRNGLPKCALGSRPGVTINALFPAYGHDPGESAEIGKTTRNVSA